MNINPNDYINVEEAVARLGGNRKLYERLIQQFIDDGYTAAVENAFQSGDENEISRQVHALKGVSANLSFSKVTSSCIEIENCIKSGLDYTDGMEKLREVLGETERVIALSVAE